MHATLLFGQLTSCTEAEVKNIHKFLSEKFFNRGTRRMQVLSLWHYIFKYYPNLRHKKLQREFVITALDISDIELNRVSSELLLSIRKILLHLHIAQKNDFMSDITLVDYFRTHQQDSFFQKTYQKVAQHLAEQPYRDHTYQYQKWQLETQKHLSDSAHNSGNTDIHLDQINQDLDLMYLSHKLLYLARSCVQSAATTNVNLSHLANELAIIDSLRLRYSENQVINIMRNMVQIFSDKQTVNIDSFKLLIDHLNTHEHLFSLELLQELHSFLRSYANIAYNRGHAAYMPIVFRLFDEHIRKGTVYENGQILPSTLQSAIITALKLNKSQWAFDTLEAHRHRIGGTEYPEQIYAFNHANCLFHIRQHQAALDELQSPFYEFHYELKAKFLRLKCLYEMESSLLESALDTFHINAVHRSQKRGQLTDIHHELGNNFTKLLRSLHQIRHIAPPDNRQKLHARLDATAIIAEREWLKEKIDSL